MKNVKLVALVVGAFVVGLSAQQFAVSNVPSKIAVVDVAQVVASSSEVKSLRKEQQTKIDELQAWLKIAQADVIKQKTEDGKQKLAKKYEADFAKKREAIENAYATKLKAIDSSISESIATEAKNSNYDVVLAKGVVLYGGEDITQKIVKTVK